MSIAGPGGPIIAAIWRINVGRIALYLLDTNLQENPPETRQVTANLYAGDLQTCGFLELPCGDLRAADFNFETLYEESDVFKNMRTLNPFSGCPARAYASTGDYMQQENG